jgi:hypothetical protein
MLLRAYALGEFYIQMIPLADELLDEHLKELESEGAP